jgi:ubiquinone/menaquinone biosynthesis C-methylase UbiE
VDYDKSEVAAVYDQARSFSPEGLQQWLDLLSRDAGLVPGALVVDLGCGTGRFSEPLAEHLGAHVIGVDPSHKMLDLARQKLRSNRVVLRQASAHSLPLAEASADMVFMSMVFHHLKNSAEVAKECRRILRDSGRVCMRNTTREADFPHRHFFPAIHPLIDTELPTRDHVRHVFERAGFTLAVHEIVRQVVAPNWPSFVHKSSLRADSFLARISDEDFASGMAALRTYATEISHDLAVVEELDWYVFTK